ncbi:uncharacterized protein LOC142982829 [Anticarsia gemmatalis]|uniref:uncharacterized protein LOC142982829 n=1 Tax=Anticarsia gemmatalis TaxID=129554 RepID=UPI003F763EE4
MTVKPQQQVPAARGLRRARALLRQTMMVVLINVPTMSFGLAMGWVSLASGESVEGDATLGGEHARELRVVVAAAVTFAASLLGVPLCARALAAGRKPALIATSAMFVACWSLKLCGGGWWLVAARACAGLAGAGAWALAPLLAREMCSERVRGAAVSALIVANNLGVLLMYLAADWHVPHRTVLWSCLCVSALHCVVFALVPESPQYLAAHGHADKARASLAWLRGVEPDAPELEVELSELPTTETKQSPFKIIREMFKDAGRRRAFTLSCIMVVGQESCGVLALLQFAERVFVLARDAAVPAATNVTLHVVADVTADVTGGPARHAVWLGVAQLLASLLALYLVERVGRKRLMVWCGLCTGACLALGAGAVAGGARALWPAAALALAVFADSAGLQPAPYAMLADMFDYEYRSCAVTLVGALAWLGNALDVAVFPAVAARGGVAAALALSAALTLALALLALCRVPETRGRTPREIYDILLGNKRDTCDSVVTCSAVTKIFNKKLVSTKVDVRMGLLDKLSVWLGRGRAEVTVLVLGLDNSGKSTLLNALRAPEQRLAHTVPTVAHHQEHFTSAGVSFSAWDVSGAPRHRALWERHYRRAHAVIFVVDAADHLRLVVAREELELLLAHPDMFGRRVPLLVFANKSDAPHALAPMQVAAALCLERMTDKPWHICASCALSGAGLADGVAWLARQLRDGLVPTQHT